MDRPPGRRSGGKLRPCPPLPSGFQVLTRRAFQWEELSGFDDEARSVRTVQICTPSSPASYWLRTRWIPRRAATKLLVEIRWVAPACVDEAALERV